MDTYIVNAPDLNEVTIGCSTGVLTLQHGSYFYNEDIVKKFPSIFKKLDIPEEQENVQPLPPPMIKVKEQLPPQEVKRGRGRPKGSYSKPR
jgi:hypothetical protein